MSQNPLTHLYRKKSLYVALPSKGKYYKDGIELSVDEELGVLPMTTADEIKLKVQMRCLMVKQCLICL